MTEEEKKIQQDAVKEQKAQDKRDAKDMEKQIDPQGDTKVEVRTPEEQEKNQNKQDETTAKQVKDQTNQGLRNDTRPGGDNGNGKTYKDERILPSDTNAPDAGVTPDGVRIAS